MKVDHVLTPCFTPGSAGRPNVPREVGFDPAPVSEIWDWSALGLTRRPTVIVPQASRAVGLLASCSRLFHPGIVFTMERSAIAPGSMIQGLLRLQHVGLLALPDLQSRLLNGASKREHE